jgi:hypothetical protein
MSSIQSEPNDSRQFDTVCKDCRYAKYNGATQTGCEFDRLDDFEEAGVTVQACYDDHKEFYVIKNRTCNLFLSENDPPKDREAWLKGSQPRIDFLILALGGESLDDLKKTCFSIVSQVECSKTLHISLHQPVFDVADLKKFLDELGLKWQINRLTESYVTKYRAIDKAAVSCKSRWLAICDAGYEYSEFGQGMNKLLNKDMKQFVLRVLPGCFVTLTWLAKRLAFQNVRTTPDGTVLSNFIDAVKYMATQDESQV